MTSILRQSYWDYLTTKTSKTNGFDTIEIDLVLCCWEFVNLILFSGALCLIKLFSLVESVWDDCKIILSHHQPVWLTATSWNDSESPETGRLLDRSHTLYWSAVMDRQESKYIMEEGNFDEKWRMESKESSQGSSTATPANTPTEETEDKGLTEQVKVNP